MKTISRLGCVLLLVMQAMLAFAKEAPLQVTVQAPYIDLRTGPGRGYPRFYAIERGATLQVLKQRTAWVKVRTENGKEGWVKAADFEKTRSAEGQAVALHHKGFSDYKTQRFEAGFSGGSFASDPMLSVFLAYRLSQAISVEANGGQITGDFSNSTFAALNVVAQPAADKRLSPYISLGYGRMENDPNRNLVSAEEVSSNFYAVGAGLRYYLSRSFVARLEYKRFNLLNSESNNDEHNAYALGLSFFF